MKKIIILFALGLPLQLMAADLNIDPQYLKIKVYKLSASKSAFCTDPITIFEESNPSYEDVLQNPTLGSGLIADGDYQCIMIEFSSYIKFAPDETSSTNCTAGSEETADVCRNGTSSTMTDGSTVNCSDNTDDRVTMWLSTGSTNTTNMGGFEPPTSGDQSKGFPLGNALSVSGTSSGKFVVDGTGKICDGADVDCDEIGCGMEPPEFSFEKI